MDSSGQRRAERDGSSAWRRRQRRLRSWWRHEQQSMAMALAAAQHHSAPKSAGPVSHYVQRNQNTAKEGTEFHAMSEDSDVVGGGRPASLVEMRHQDKLPRHSVEHSIENFVPVQILDGPVPQSSMSGVQDQILRRTAELVTEEVMLVIEVPKISFQDRIPRRASLAEQLVEVPVPVRVPSFSDWVRWEETYRRTSHTWLGGFEWCLIPSRRATASPGRSTSLVSYSCSSSSPSLTSSSSTEGWTFQVWAGTHSAQCAEDRWCKMMCATFLVEFGHCACAMPGSTADTCSACLGGFIEVFPTWR